MPNLKTVPMIGHSDAMRMLRHLISTLAGSRSTVLIIGESGTGKELVARELHALGARADGPFVPLNCGAIPRELIESELFGHRKGAFTGALSDRIGRFELANGGTLFLDEIGDLPPDLQVKLLRVLQERCVEPLGSTRPVQVDVRIVAATHRDLEAEVRAGRFREDLYYRLNVVPIRTAPLRERTEDIDDLVGHFAAAFAQPGHAPVRLGPDLLRVFQLYRWPGNIRELSNLLDRFSAIFAGQSVEIWGIPEWMLPSGMVELKAGLTPFEPASVDQPALAMAVESGDDADLMPWGLQAASAEPAVIRSAPPQGPSRAARPASNDGVNTVEEAILRAQGIAPLQPGGISLRDKMIDIERSYIEQALEQTQWNVSQTARLLNLQRTTLIEKINKYGLRRG